MHTIHAIDLMRQRRDHLAAGATQKAPHLAALRAACVRAPGVRGLLGACSVSGRRDS